MKFYCKLSYFIIFVATFTIMFFTLAISPKFPTYYFQYNQQIFYIIGKMMKNGKIPYVDMIDHKGIYIFILHYIAELICENNHIGLFLLGLISMYLAAIIIFKLVLLFTNQNTKSISIFIAIIVSILSVVLQCIYYFSMGPLQCETFILPLISYSIYLYCKSILNSDTDSVPKSMFIHGVLAGVILFIKANYCLFYLSIIILTLNSLLKNKNYKQIYLCFLYGIAGVFVAILPGLVYCIANNCLYEMIYNSFVVNAIYSKAPYHGVDTKLGSIILSIKEFKNFFIILLIILICSYKIILRTNYVKVLKFLLVSFLFLTISIFMSARPYFYYLILLFPYLCIGLFLIIEYFYELIEKNNNKLLCNVSVTIFTTINILVSVVLLYNDGYKKMIEDAKVRDETIRIVKSAYYNRPFNIGNSDNALVVGTSIYLYNELNILPDFQYFCLPIIMSKYYERPFVEICKYIAERKPDIIILSSYQTIMADNDAKVNIFNAIQNNYEVMVSSKGVTILKKKF